MVSLQQGSCIIDYTTETKKNFQSQPSSTFMTEQKRIKVELLFGYQQRTVFVLGRSPVRIGVAV